MTTTLNSIPKLAAGPVWVTLSEPVGSADEVGGTLLTGDADPESLIVIAGAGTVLVLCNRQDANDFEGGLPAHQAGTSVTYTAPEGGGGAHVADRDPLDPSALRMTLFLPDGGQTTPTGGTLTLLVTVDDGDPVETEPIDWNADLQAAGEAIAAAAGFEEWDGSGDALPGELTIFLEGDAVGHTFGVEVGTVDLDDPGDPAVQVDVLDPGGLGDTGYPAGQPWVNSEEQTYFVNTGDAESPRWVTFVAPEQFTELQEEVAALQDEINSEHASVDQEVTTTVLFSHPELGNNCSAGFQWSFQFLIFLLSDGATEGVKFALAGNQELGSFGITVQVTIYDDTLGVIAGTGRLADLGDSFGADLSAGVNHAVIEGVADIGDEPTQIILQFAQFTTGAGAGVHVQVNSSVIFTRLAQSS